MKRYFTLANLIAITLAGFFGVKLFYAWATQDLYVLPASRGYPKTRTAIKKAPPPLSAYQNVLNRGALFGNPSAGPPVPASKATAVEGLQPTRLNLKLWGTVTFEKGGGFAVIEDVSAKKQDLFTAGQKIQSATLKLILRDRVVLSVNGKDRILNMEVPKSLPKRTRPVAVSVPRSLPKPITLSRRQIDEALQNIHELMTQIKIRPHFFKGRPEGLAVGGIGPGSIFSNMGLRNGDIITGVNGEKILSVEDALKLYRSIRSGTSVNVEIKRAGKTKTLVYRIE